MRTLAIGDAHGCSVALETLLSVVSVGPNDTVVMLGDYVDRGPDTRGVLERVIALCREVKVVALRGNHEQMMLWARDDFYALRDWRRHGGEATEASYGGLQAVPDSHWQFITEQCRDYWETKTHIFVHAGVEPDIPLREQSRDMLHWSLFDTQTPHESGKQIVCGHTSQKNGLPRNRGFAVCIDTYAHGGGWLSCLDVESGKIWQANQRGQHREFLLNTPSRP